MKCPPGRVRHARIQPSIAAPQGPTLRPSSGLPGVVGGSEGDACSLHAQRSTLYGSGSSRQGAECSARELRPWGTSSPSSQTGNPTTGSSRNRATKLLHGHVSCRCQSLRRVPRSHKHLHTQCPQMVSPHRRQSSHTTLPRRQSPPRDPSLQRDHVLMPLRSLLGSRGGGVLVENMRACWFARKTGAAVRASAWREARAKRGVAARRTDIIEDSDSRRQGCCQMWPRSKQIDLRTITQINLFVADVKGLIT